MANKILNMCLHSVADMKNKGCNFMTWLILYITGSTMTKCNYVSFFSYYYYFKIRITHKIFKKICSWYLSRGISCVSDICWQKNKPIVMYNSNIVYCFGNVISSPSCRITNKRIDKSHQNGLHHWIYLDDNDDDDDQMNLSIWIISV